MKKIMSAAVSAAMLLSTLAIPANAFRDVEYDENDRYSLYLQKAIEYADENRYMVGCGDDMFCPDMLMTRAQVVQVLYMIEKNCFGDPDVDKTGYFTDVPDAAWFSPAVYWAYGIGLTSGTGDGVFSPSQKITWQEIAVFFRKYCELKSVRIDSDENAVENYINLLIALGVAEQTDSSLYENSASWAKNAYSDVLSNNIFSIFETENTALKRDTLIPTSYVERMYFAEQLYNLTYNFIMPKIANKVILNANGGECAESDRYVKFGDALGTLPLPVREGYKFDGWWYTDAANNEIRATAATVFDTEDDVTLTAHWGEGNKVSFNANGGTCAEEYRFVKPTQPLGALPTPEREGYKFDGWMYTAPNETQMRVSADSIIDTDVDYTLVACWGEGSRVSFDAAGGVCDEEYRFVKAQNALGTLPLPVREGYKFDGWWYTGAANNEIRATAATVLETEDDITLTAHWGEGNKVSFNANGGTCAEEYRFVKSDSALGELPVPVKDGAEFDGWYYTNAQNITEKVNAETIINVDYDYMLTAHWN